MAYDDELQAHKTGRIAILSVLLFALGALVFCFKVDACNSKGTCNDEFLEFAGDGRSRACTPGATAEVVSSPPAPKPGLLCHCGPKAVPVPATPTPNP